MRVLLVEDEEKLSGLIASELKAEGFTVDTARDGQAGLEMATTYSYDTIILDLMLPQMSGSEVLDGIRKTNRQVPIMMLTARDTVADKVRHMDAGADDYLTKPFSFEELMVRIRALLRRAPKQWLDVIKIGDLEIDRLARKVKRGGARVDLSAKEFGLLEYLALNSGKVLSRSMIIENVWGESFEALTNIVDVYVRQLRVKVDENYSVKLIKTIRGVGYMLSETDI